MLCSVRLCCFFVSHKNLSQLRVEIVDVALLVVVVVVVVGPPVPPVGGGSRPWTATDLRKRLLPETLPETLADDEFHRGQDRASDCVLP